MKSLLFICIGNVCRSPMAEGFAKCYGSDVVNAESFGVAPVPSVPPLGIAVMAEKGIDISRHRSRMYMASNGAAADIVVNMSGYRLQGAQPRNLIEWKIDDPYGKSIKEFRATRDVLEQKVMQLILQIRKGQFG